MVWIFSEFTAAEREITTRVINLLMILARVFLILFLLHMVLPEAPQMYRLRQFFGTFGVIACLVAILAPFDVSAYDLAPEAMIPVNLVIVVPFLYFLARLVKIFMSPGRDRLLKHFCSQLGLDSSYLLRSFLTFLGKH